MHKKLKILLLLILILTTAVGCWDAIEIEDRAFVLALGVDKYEPEGPDDPPVDPRHRYVFTFMMPMEGGGNGDATNVVLKTVGPNIFTSRRIVSTRADKEIFLGHLKVLVVGEEVARDPKMFREILDAVERDRLISRRMSIAIAQGKASDVLEVEPAMEPITAQFLAELFRSKVRSSRVGQGIVGNVFADLHRWGNTVIPRVNPGEEDMKVAANAVIKNYKMVGWLGEIETRSLMTLREEAPPGEITVSYKDHILPTNLVYKDAKFHLVEKEDSFKIRITIDAEGDIEQFYFDPEEDLMDPEVLAEIQGILSADLKAELDYTINKIQQEFQVDVIGIDHYLDKFHHSLWRQVRDDWEELFPELEIETVVDVQLRRIGLTK